MKRTRIFPKPETFPEEFRQLLNCPVYDSSCSKIARVYYLDNGPGYYLKTAATGTLEKEAKLTAFFHEKGLAAQVLAYSSLAADWLLTERVPGEDCTLQTYREDPLRLCDTLGELLAMLHSQDPTSCPVPNRTSDYLEAARNGYLSGSFDPGHFPLSWRFSSREEAWNALEANRKYLKSDTLIHGDFCLPNIMLDNWRFSGFIDLDHSGIGDRHVDLFWGMWSLWYNLKTDAYFARFLDAYGRKNFSPDALRAVAAAEVFG